ncbi:MAG: exosortase-associated EpsI family protein [Verrucomicrobiota bacterium]
MKKNNWILLIIALVMIGGTARFLAYIKVNQRLGKPGVLLGNTPLFDTETNRVANTTVILPENIPGYSSVAMPVTSIELSMLPKDTTFGKRRYWTSSGGNADLSVVLMGQDRTSIHKPEFCLVGQGWTIEQTEKVNLKMKRPYEYEMPVMKMTASIHVKDDNGNPMVVRGIYVYWFVADNKLTASHDARMLSMARNLLTTGTLERWAYISYFSRCYPGKEDETFNRLNEFIVSSAPEFQLAAGKPSPISPVKIQTASK